MNRDKSNLLALLALLAAVVILGVFGINSYFKYRLAVETKNSGASVAAEATPPVAAPPAPPEAPATPEPSETDTIATLPRTVLPPIPPEILNAKAPDDQPGRVPSPSQPTGTAGMPSAPAGSPTAETLRREAELYQAKLDQLRSGKPSSPLPSAPLPPADVVVAPPVSPVGDTPDSALRAAMNPAVPIPATEPGNDTTIPPPPLPPLVGPVGDAPAPAGAPGEAPPAQTATEVAAMAEQVRRQPAIAQVIAYNNEFAIVVIDGGKNRNITPEMRLAVRRGSDIVGFIKVVEVEDTQSVAELMSKNKFSPTARKPEAGDDVIAFNLF
ncbi:MAG: hypothetical protein JNK37_03460 [Verrucomicrobiales bacterium]|nr:hypothetical protein [Verrucomicrobiales bacterium]